MTDISISSLTQSYNGVLFASTEDNLVRDAAPTGYAVINYVRDALAGVDWDNFNEQSAEAREAFSALVGIGYATPDGREILTRGFALNYETIRQYAAGKAYPEDAGQVQKICSVLRPPVENAMDNLEGHLSRAQSCTLRSDHS